MKIFIKILVTILCVTTVLVSCVPFGSAEETIDESIAQNETEINEETVIPEEDSSEIVDEETQEDYEENYAPPAEEEKEYGYFTTAAAIVAMGFGSIGEAVAALGATVISPLLFLVFPPFGAAALIGGIPYAAYSLLVGIGEIIASPILAFWVIS